MKQFLEVGKYYNGIFDNADIGEHQIAFMVKKIQVVPLDDEDADWASVSSDKAYRNEKGLPDYKKYDFDYSLHFEADVMDESEVLEGEFTLITEQSEIEKVKEKIGDFVEYENEYYEAMASKYPEY